MREVKAFKCLEKIKDKLGSKVTNKVFGSLTVIC